MNAKIKDGKQFCSIIDSIKGLVRQCVFKCNSEGIDMHSMDQSLVCLVELKLTHEDCGLFDSYHCEEDIVISLDLVNLSLISKCIEKGDKIELDYKKDSDKLTVIIGYDKENIKEFEFSLVDLDDNDINTGGIEYNLVFNMDSKKFKKTISVFESIGDSLEFNTFSEDENKVIEMKSKGEICSLTEKLDIENDIKIEKFVTLNSSYRLNYLQSFTKATDLSKTVQISMSEEFPFDIIYKINNSDKNSNSFVRYCLAPKTDDDDDYNDYDSDD